MIDGSGRPRFVADVCLDRDRITGVGDLGGATAVTEIDARQRVLAPGFIDTHTHDDRALLINPEMSMKVSQGVTSVVVGNCGISLAPLGTDRAPPAPLDLLGGAEDFAFPTQADYVSTLQDHPAAVNWAALVGHTTLRVGAMTDLERAATDAELGRMQDGLREGLAAGAIGFSTGFFYSPAAAATVAETAALAEIVGAVSGIYAAHIRDESDHVIEALQEALSIGQAGNTPVVISHHKVHGRANYGRTQETLAFLDDARKRQTVGFDVYPYNAASSTLMPEFVAACDRVVVTASAPHPEMAGRDLEDIAGEWGCDIKAAARRLQPGGATYFLMDEADVRRVLSHPGAMIGSDGIPHGEHPHPRLWGTFPRVLGHYARDLGLFELEDAIHRMSGLPAATFGFQGRGSITPGAFADLVLLDPATVIDRASYEQPQQAAAGIDLVLVNGEIVWQCGKPTGAHPGRRLERVISNEHDDSNAR